MWKCQTCHTGDDGDLFTGRRHDIASTGPYSRFANHDERTCPGCDFHRHG
jgi:hypothetical protein